MKVINSFLKTRIQDMQQRGHLMGSSDILLGVLSAAMQTNKTIARLKKKQEESKRLSKLLSHKLNSHSVSLEDLSQLSSHRSPTHKRIPSTFRHDSPITFASSSSGDSGTKENDEAKSETSEDKSREEEEESSLSFIATRFETSQKKHKRQPSLPISAFPSLSEI